MQVACDLCDAVVVEVQHLEAREAGEALEAHDRIVREIDGVKLVLYFINCMIEFLYDGLSGGFVSHRGQLASKRTIALSEGSIESNWFCGMAQRKARDSSKAACRQDRGRCGHRQPRTSVAPKFSMAPILLPADVINANVINANVVRKQVPGEVRRRTQGSYGKAAAGWEATAAARSHAGARGSSGRQRAPPSKLTPQVDLVVADAVHVLRAAADQLGVEPAEQPRPRWGGHCCRCCAALRAGAARCCCRAEPPLPLGRAASRLLRWPGTCPHRLLGNLRRWLAAP